jgi:hypothetical protein
MKKQKNIFPIVIGAGALLYFLFGTKKTGQTKEQESSAKDLQQAGKPSYTDTQYQLAANRLEQAMFDAGTDENAINQIFGLLKNNADFLKLNIAFGQRRYTGGLIPGIFYDKLTLTQWLQEELNEAELNGVNQILRSKGITYSI